MRHPPGSGRISRYCFLPGHCQPCSPGKGASSCPRCGRGHLDTAQQSWNHLFWWPEACQGIFHGVLLGNHPSPWIEKPQCTNAMEKSLLCCFQPEVGECLSSLHIASRTHRREGTFLGQVIPGGRPSGGHQHQFLWLGAHCF